MRHTWYVCERTCNGCMFCDGGLSACTTCGGLEGSLTTECLGTRVANFTLNKVCASELDFVNGTWVRSRGLMARLRGKSMLECREICAEVEALPSMQRARAIRGW